MEKEYRILEEDGHFFIQEKIHNDELSFLEIWLNCFFILEKNFTWEVVIVEYYLTLEEAKLKVYELRKEDLNIKNIKYHKV